MDVHLEDEDGTESAIEEGTYERRNPIWKSVAMVVGLVAVIVVVLGLGLVVLF